MAFSLDINRLSFQRLLLCVFAALSQHISGSKAHPDHVARSPQATSAASPLVDFQVYEPVLTPAGSTNQYGCVYTQLLMDHVFGFSYGMPFVGDYSPPPCSFNRVTMNFTVTSRGRQFDRLGLMYLGDIEVFRTSTAEPTANGIIWTYVKEMDQYDSLWKTKQKIIFDLGNLIDRTYTGSFNTTLTATFFTVPESRATADTILPISSRQSSSNMPSAFSVPSQNASVSYTFPRNIQRAVVSLSACGQASEEFWYTNTFSSLTDTFESTAGTLYGYSPFREVQLLIDGQLAGVSWPFPIIFTGGIVPGLWRPIVGIDAFDLREHEIDITPWLPILCDGSAHTFEIRVAGLDDNGGDHATLTKTVGSYWVVSGKIFIFLDESKSVTTGTPPDVTAPSPQIQISSSITMDTAGDNETLTYNTVVSRYLSISSTISTSHGSRPVSWNQSLIYTNNNAFINSGLTQSTTQNTSGIEAASQSGYATIYSYPLFVDSTFESFPSGAFSINASISRGLDLNVLGTSVFPSGVQSFNVTSPALMPLPGRPQPQTITLPSSLPKFNGALLSTTQTGSAAYLSAGNASYSFGTTEQDFDFKGAELRSDGPTFELYTRHVKAVNSTVTEDEQNLIGRSFEIPTGQPGLMKGAAGLDGLSVRAMLGRGPGRLKAGLVGGGPS
ncbi:MAG: hypothetical protein Q9195_006212 [Heterodermia aff. obscurata]